MPNVVFAIMLMLAEHAWGKHAEVNGISMKDLGPCEETAAWADFTSRTITLNSECDGWTPELMQGAVTHEYGHLLCLCNDHSRNTESVMYPVISATGKVLEEDLWRVDVEVKEKEKEKVSPN